MNELRNNRRDNHAGPGFDAVRAAFPNATRMHWSDNAFRPSDSCWLVGTPTQCGGGSGVFWLSVNSDGKPLNCSEALLPQLNPKE